MYGKNPDPNRTKVRIQQSDVRLRKKNRKSKIADQRKLGSETLGFGSRRLQKEDSNRVYALQSLGGQGYL